MKHIDRWELVPTTGKTWSVKGSLNGEPWMTSTLVRWTKGIVYTQNSVYSLGNCAMGAGKIIGALTRDREVESLFV